MSFIRIIHEYVVEVPDAAPQDPEWDSIANMGVSIMEDHMKRANPTIKDMRSSWETMPKEYAPIQTTPQTGTVHRGRMPSEEELAYYSEHGVSFVSDIMGGVGGVQHPHDVGLQFFPDDHPLHQAEKKIIADAEVVEEGKDNQPKQIEEGEGEEKEDRG